MNTAKSIHKLVTTLGFNSHYKNPQDLYREVYRELGVEKETCEKISKLEKTLKLKLLTKFLVVVLDKTRKRTMLGNKLTDPAPYKMNIGGVRHYFMDGVNYPSVTAILKHGKEKGYDVFGKWEASLLAKHGEKVGRRKFEIASQIGDFTHSVIESYLRTKRKDKSIIERTLAKHLIPFLDDIDVVLGVEFPVHSKRGFAGTVDCLAKMKDGSVHLIDFKTSKSARTKSNCHDYRCQLAAYALAIHEQHGIKVDAITLAVVYKSVIGVKKPRRFDILTTTEIRPYVIDFLTRLDYFQQNKEELGLEVAF